jgi:hypothetical protein
VHGYKNLAEARRVVIWSTTLDPRTVLSNNIITQIEPCTRVKTAFRASRLRHYELHKPERAAVGALQAFREDLNLINQRYQ